MVHKFLQLNLASAQSVEVREALQEDFAETDSFMMKVIVAHWVMASTIMGISQGYYVAGFIGGGVICGFAYAGYRYLGGTVYSRLLMAICLMLFSALFIQQSLGRIEYHFHVFGAMAFLIRYKDVRPVIAAVVTIAVHHLIFNYCQQYNVAVFGTPLMVFNYGYGLGIVLLHAAFVLFEALFLMYIIVQLTEQFCDRTRDAGENLEILETLKYVISTKDVSARIDQTNARAGVLNELLDVLNASTAVHEAMAKASTSLIITDNELRIIDCNVAAATLFEAARDEYRRAGIELDEDGLIGYPVSRLIVCEDADSIERSRHMDFKVGNRTFAIDMNPVINSSGERLGAIFEWRDRTQEVRIEQEVHDMVLAASKGDLSGRISTEMQHGFYGVLAEHVNQLISVAEGVIADCSAVLGALARGDLTRSIEREYEGQFGRLTHDVNTTTHQLADIVSQIKATAADIDKNVAALQRGNRDVSQSNRTQAQSLDETASNMKQLTESVLANADNALMAKDLTGKASEQAEQGGRAIRKAVEAMSEITAASEKIGEITGVIDEIAFQTNLLALNASVEAARAGEQGRGFAVVASEVRNLAGRSATAAKEISALMADTARKVGDGARMVDESGQVLGQIVESIQAAREKVVEIASATHTQSDRIQDVNGTISSINQMTQKNSALAESASAASISMGERSNSLRELVGVFSTDDAGDAEFTTGRLAEAVPGASQ